MVTPTKMHASRGKKEEESGPSTPKGHSWTERLKEMARLERIKGNRARLDSLLFEIPRKPEDASSLALEILEALFKEIESPETFWHKGALIGGIRLGGGPLTVFIQGQKETGHLVLLLSPEKKENQGFYLCGKLNSFKISDEKQGSDEKLGYLVEKVIKTHQELFGNATDGERKILVKMAASAIFKELKLEWPSPASQP